MNQAAKQYLFWFAQKHCDFRRPEMLSIFNMFGQNICRSINWQDQPYCIVSLPSEQVAREIVSRAVCIRFCLELWANSKESDELHETLQNYPRSAINEYAGKEKSFKIVVETFCRHFTQQEKIQKIESFSYLPLEGPVNLSKPDTTFYYIEFYGLDSNHKPDKPYELFFGRWIAEGQRDLIQKLSLRTRKFIGNTTMDPELSLIMANQAKVKKGDLVFDPFVGSGSLLVAASHFGGYTLGTDIDFLMLHGRTRPSRKSQTERESDENIAANMEQYGVLSYYVDAVVADFSSPLWRTDMRVNAIITDPPYGIREATERIGTTKSSPVIEDHQVATHIPSKIAYNLTEMYKDLLTFSANHLVQNGRLVCWFPVLREHYAEDKLPVHPCLKLVANSEQVLSKYTSRRLLTYEKLKDPQKSDECATIKLMDFREKYLKLRNETRRQRRRKEPVRETGRKAEKAANRGNPETRKTAHNGDLNSPL